MDAVQDFYQQRIADHGLSYQTVWGDAEDWKAKARFQIIEPQDFAAGDRLVDLGCGVGLLKDYLNNFIAPPLYTAVDVIPEFLTEVAARHNVPAVNCDFFADLVNVPAADWYANFGALNKKWILKLADSDDVDAVYSWIAACFHKARKGMYLSCFSDRTDMPKAGNVHLNPFKILDVCKDARSYRVRHDTDFYEFTMMIGK